MIVSKRESETELRKAAERKRQEAEIVAKEAEELQRKEKSTFWFRIKTIPIEKKMVTYSGIEKHSYPTTTMWVFRRDRFGWHHQNRNIHDGYNLIKS